MTYYGGAYAPGPGMGPAQPEIRPLWMDIPESVLRLVASLPPPPPALAQALQGLDSGSQAWMSPPQVGFGQAQAGASAPQLGMSPPAAGVSAMGVSPFGASPMGVSPFGVSPMGVAPMGAGPTAGTSSETNRQLAAATLTRCYRWLEQSVPLQPSLASLVPPLVAAVSLYSAQQYESCLSHASTVVAAIGNARTAMPSLPAL
jgi:hypothetical protein